MRQLSACKGLYQPFPFICYYEINYAACLMKSRSKACAKNACGAIVKNVAFNVYVLILCAIKKLLLHYDESLVKATRHDANCHNKPGYIMM